MTKTIFITGNNFLHIHDEYNPSWADGMRTQEKRKKWLRPLPSACIKSNNWK